MQQYKPQSFDDQMQTALSEDSGAAGDTGTGRPSGGNMQMPVGGLNFNMNGMDNI